MTVLVSNKEWRTIREWLNELPDKERTRALNNVMPHMLEATYPSMNAALHRAFVWGSTKEKHEYWHVIAKRYEEPMILGSFVVK